MAQAMRTPGPSVIGSLWRRLTRAQRVILVGVSVANTAGAVAVVWPSVIIGQIVTSLTADSAASITDRIARLAGLLGLFVVLRVAIHISLHQVMPRVEAGLREAQIKHTLKTPVSTSTSDTYYAAELNSLMGKGAKAGADTVKIVFNDLMPAIMQALVAAVTAFTTQWQVGMVMLASGVVSTVITQLQLRSQGGVRVGINRAKARLDGLMTELLRGKAVIRTLDAADAESTRVGRRALELSAIEVRHHKMMGLFDAGKTAAESAFAVVVLLIAAAFVVAGASAGLVLTLYLLFMQFATPLRDIHRIRDELNEASLQLAEVFKILRAPLDRIFTQPTIPMHGADTAVTVDHATIGYENDTVVRDVSVTVASGAYLGICGPAGCGKSTLAKALVGILPLTGGRMTLDGADITTLNAEQLAGIVSYVPQEPYVISGTVRDNLLLGQPQPLDNAHLIDALKQVGLCDELTGLDEPVGEDGLGLSGGQRQRLVLARVLLRPAPIIVLDEATSALDNLNEEVFMQALMATQRTVIAIAHRLSTLRHADHIIVMQDGQIGETGTYDILDHEGGLFHDLLHAGEPGQRVIGVQTARANSVITTPPSWETTP